MDRWPTHFPGRRRHVVRCRGPVENGTSKVRIELADRPPVDVTPSCRRPLVLLGANTGRRSDHRHRCRRRERRGSRPPRGISPAGTVTTGPVRRGRPASTSGARPPTTPPRRRGPVDRDCPAHPGEHPSARSGRPNISGRDGRAELSDADQRGERGAGCPQVGDRRGAGHPGSGQGGAGHRTSPLTASARWWSHGARGQGSPRAPWPAGD